MVLELKGLLKMKSSIEEFLEHSNHLLLWDNLVIDHMEDWAPVHSWEFIELGRV
jgi:hypothetical protein